MYLLAEIVKKWVSLIFVDSSKNILSGCTINKSELGVVMLTGAPEYLVERLSGYAQC